MGWRGRRRRGPQGPRGPPAERDARPPRGAGSCLEKGRGRVRPPERGRDTPGAEARPGRYSPPERPRGARRAPRPQRLPRRPGGRAGGRAETPGGGGGRPRPTLASGFPAAGAGGPRSRGGAGREDGAHAARPGAGDGGRCLRAARPAPQRVPRVFGDPVGLPRRGQRRRRVRCTGAGDARAAGEREATRVAPVPRSCARVLCAGALARLACVGGRWQV